MFNDVPENEREKKLVDGGLDISRLENISLVDREGNAVIRRHLESLPLESFDSVSSMISFLTLEAKYEKKTTLLLLKVNSSLFLYFILL